MNIHVRRDQCFAKLEKYRAEYVAICFNLHMELECSA